MPPSCAANNLHLTLNEFDVGGPAEVHRAVEALRAAFAAAMKDKAFLACAAKRKMDLSPLSGAEVQKMVMKHLATPSAIVKMANKAAGMK